MAGKTYNAGTIFLQVVPVFGDTMNAIKRQAKDLDKALTEEADKAAKTSNSTMRWMSSRPAWPTSSAPPPPAPLSWTR